MTELIDSFSRIVSIIVAFVGVAGTLFFVYGAFQYMSAGGNTSKAEGGKSAMVQAGVGVVLAIVAFAVINTITSQIGESGGAVQVQQVVGTDAQRLEAPRVTTVGQNSDGSFVVTFTEAQGQIRAAAKADGEPILELTGTSHRFEPAELLFHTFMSDAGGVYKSDLTMRGESYSEHEFERGSLVIHPHEMTAGLTIDEIAKAPFREQWMKKGVEVFAPLEAV